jgi:hypothetical protein
MFEHAGFRMAAAGFVLLLVGTALLLLSKIVAVVLMLIGGLGVFFGFVSTLMYYYVGQDKPPE